MYATVFDLPNVGIMSTQLY